MLYIYIGLYIEPIGSDLVRLVNFDYFIFFFKIEKSIIIPKIRNLNKPTPDFECFKIFGYCT